jgi:hypothetical protein
MMQSSYTLWWWSTLHTCPGEWVLHPRTSPWIAAALMVRPAILHSAWGKHHLSVNTSLERKRIVVGGFDDSARSTVPLYLDKKWCLLQMVLRDAMLEVSLWKLVPRVHHFIRSEQMSTEQWFIDTTSIGGKQALRASTMHCVCWSRRRASLRSPSSGGRRSLTDEELTWKDQFVSVHPELLKYPQCWT